jgi:hypothetical protein
MTRRALIPKEQVRSGVTIRDNCRHNYWQYPTFRSQFLAKSYTWPESDQTHAPKSVRSCPYSVRAVGQPPAIGRECRSAPCWRSRVERCLHQWLCLSEREIAATTLDSSRPYIVPPARRPHMASRLPSEEPEAETSRFSGPTTAAPGPSHRRARRKCRGLAWSSERKMRFQPSAVHTGVSLTPGNAVRCGTAVKVVNPNILAASGRHRKHQALVGGRKTQAQQSTLPVTLLESYSTCARPRLRIHCGAQHALRTLFDTYLKVGIILGLGRRMLMHIYMSRSQRL